MNSPCTALLLVLLLGSVPGQVTAPPQVFPLYRMDKSCFCINTRKQTPTLKATEITSSGTVFQVFHSRSGRLHEMFRVKIGTTGETWWNYGIADEADFNGDGVPDYSWCGGDDTGFVMYLFLSSGEGYKQVDVLGTVQAAWQRRFHTAPPDLGEAGGDHGIRHLQLERSASGLALLATVSKVLDDKKDRPLRFRIAEKDFRK